MFVKLVSSNMINRGFQLKAGLNVDTVPFSHDGSCVAGGLYYCDVRDIGCWLDCLNYTHLCTVTIPEDAQTVKLPYKYRSDKIILSQPYLIKDHSIWTDNEICKMVIQQDGLALQYIPTQVWTDELVELAVQENGLALQYIPTQVRRSELVELAVQENGHALQYVQGQHLTEKVIELAVQENGHALQYVQAQHLTEKIIERGVKSDGIALRYVPVQARTDKIIKLTVRGNGQALRYVQAQHQTDEIIKMAVLENWDVELNMLRT